MSSVTTQNLSGSLHPSIRQKLRMLRMRLTWWMVVDGLVWLLIAALIFAVADMVFDRFFKMDFSQRVIMLCLMGGGLLTIAVLKIFKPLSHSTTDDALILEVESKNRDLKESLISSVQLGRSQNVEGKGMSPSLVQATIEQGIERSKSISFTNALNQKRGMVNWLLLAVAALGIGGIGFGVASGNEFLGTWFNRNILLKNELWPQNTYLVFPQANDGLIIGTRGRDLKVLVQVDSERSTVKDVDVELEIDDGQTRSRQQMKKTGKDSDYQHLVIVRNVTSEFRVRARGSDEITEWVKVELVDEPVVTSLQLIAELPEYVGQNRIEKLEGSGPHSVLTGSRLKLVAKVNKPLSVARLNLAGDSFPLVKTDELTYTLNLPESGPLLGGKYIFDLEDLAGKKSEKPVSFGIKIRQDKPPLVRASLNGISGLVVPKAVLPFSFSANDEYGLTRLAIKYSYQAGESSIPVEKIVDIPLEFDEEATDKSSIETGFRLDLRPDEIPVGVTLKLNILAWDNQPQPTLDENESGENENEPDTPNGVAPGQSREFLLRVVTEDELREDLLRREVEQRGAFEQAYTNQLDLQSELRGLAAALPVKADSESEQDRINAEFFEEREVMLLALLRRQKIIGTNIIAVAERFKTFVVEAENNRESEKKINLGPGFNESFEQRNFHAQNVK